MPSSILRYSAVAALLSSTACAVRTFGAFPTQTDAGGGGLPIIKAMATEAPSLELVKRQLEKRQSLINVCSEWTILGGNGQPQCSNSQTCLFSSVGGTFYEGCGQESISYDWITECSAYPNTGLAGVSQIFCNSAFPFCGTFEFIVRAGATYSNFGCGTKAYSYKATLLPTSGTVSLNGGSQTSVIVPSGTVSVSNIPTDILSSGEIFQPTRTGTRGSDTPSPKKSTPVGAIVGGVIGGIAVIAIIGFLAWFCLRKRREDKEKIATLERQQADAATAQAYHNSNQIPEVDGTTTVKPGVGAFAPVNQNYNSQSEKPIGGVATNEYRPQPQSQYSSGYGTETDPRSTTASPPPMYPHPPQNGQAAFATTPGTVSSPSSQYTELDPASATGPRHSSIPPVSPAGTNTGTFVSGNVSELGGGENRMSYQAYHPPQSPHHPPIPEIGGASGAGNASSGGINRRPVAQQQPAVDMSGAPLNENYRPHELP